MREGPRVRLRVLPSAKREELGQIEAGPPCRPPARPLHERYRFEGRFAVRTPTQYKLTETEISHPFGGALFICMSGNLDQANDEQSLESLAEAITVHLEK